MKSTFRMAILVAVLGIAAPGHGVETSQAAQGAAGGMPAAIFTNLQDFKWNKILPTLGEVEGPPTSADISK